MKNEQIFNKPQNIPPSIIAWAESLKDRAGIYATTYQEQNIYLIAAGLCPSGGYHIVITSGVEPDTVYYQVNDPAPDDFVIQILTYPYELLFTKQKLRFFNHNCKHFIEPQFVKL